MKNDKDIAPEDKERWNLDRERDADALIDYSKVERVIGSKDDEEDGDQMYFVKCKWPQHRNISTELT